MLGAGIVGLPNVGKSTLFNAVTRTHKAPAENYPFCTIDPNVGVVTVPDPRLKEIAEISHSKKITPTAIDAALTPEEELVARGLFLLSSKPTIFACNVAESDLSSVADVDDVARNQAPRSHDTGITDRDRSATEYVTAVQKYARDHFATE